MKYLNHKANNQTLDSVDNFNSCYNCDKVFNDNDEVYASKDEEAICLDCYTNEIETAELIYENMLESEATGN